LRRAVAENEQQTGEIVKVVKRYQGKGYGKADENRAKMKA
jgi:hypothetical protein